MADTRKILFKINDLKNYRKKLDSQLIQMIPEDSISIKKTILEKLKFIGYLSEKKYTSINDLEWRDLIKAYQEYFVRYRRLINYQ